ncbi:MAG: signal peptidase I [Bacilli bacterium]|nr:signal peptidase I [Bacilli bacterium]
MKLLKSLIPYIVIIIVVVLLRSFIVTPIRVNGNSMHNTLAGGEIMLLNKLGHIDRYDIVVVNLDIEEENIIKRVIGMPGETLEIINNEIFINGEIIEDKYGYYENEEYVMNTDKITLGENEYYVLGDNRVVSLDSRIFGKVNKKDIKGTTNFIIFPFAKFGHVE